MSGVLPKTFRREIIILFIGKLFVLGILFSLCFSPKTRPGIDAPKMADAILCTKEGAPNDRP